MHLEGKTTKELAEHFGYCTRTRPETLKLLKFVNRTNRNTLCFQMFFEGQNEDSGQFQRFPDRFYDNLESNPICELATG